MPKSKPKYIIARGSKPNAKDERKYRNQLLKLINEINELVRREVMPIVRADGKSIEQSIDKRLTQDGPIASITASFGLIQQLLNFDKSANEQASGVFVGSVAASSGLKADAILKRGGMLLPQNAEIIAREGITEALSAMTAENASLVTNMAQGYIDRIQRTVLDNYLTGKYIGKGGIQKELSRISGITKKRAKVIARDQSNKIHGAVVKIRAQATGSIGYKWNTVRDIRVRGNPSGKYPDVKPSRNHWERDGKYYLWKPMKNPPIAPDGKPFRQPPQGGSPGQDYNCRCFGSVVWVDE